MKKLRISPLLSAIILIIVGVILVLYSGDALSTILRIVAIGLLVIGVIGVSSYFLGKDDGKKSVWRMLIAAIEAIAGLIILIRPQIILNIYPIAMGIIIAVDGLGNLFQALSMKRRANSHWKPMLILACITIVFGIIIVCNPFSTLNALTSVIGIVLAYDGVTRFLAAVRK